VPLLLGWSPVAGQVIDGVFDLCELHPNCLGAADERHSSEDISGVAPLAPLGAGGGDEPGVFIETQRRGRHADAGGRLPDGQLITLGT